MTDQTTRDRVRPLTLWLSVLAIGGFVVAETLSPGAGPWILRSFGILVALWVLWILRRARTA